MEPFPPLTVFYITIADYARIRVTHISLYMALLQQWNINSGINPATIIRVDIMKAEKINTRYILTSVSIICKSLAILLIYPLLTLSVIVQFI